MLLVHGASMQNHMHQALHLTVPTPLTLADLHCAVLCCVLLRLPGYIPCINYATHQARFACLVAHLQRPWDYTSCVEAQLKVWLAHYLLSAANPGGYQCRATAVLRRYRVAQIYGVVGFVSAFSESFLSTCTAGL